MASSKQDSDSDSDSEDNSNTSQRKEYSKIVSTQFGDANAHDVAVGGIIKKNNKKFVFKKGSTLIMDPTAGPSHQHQPDLNSNSEPRAGPSWEGQSGATEATDYTVFTERIKEDYKKLLLPGIAWITKGESSIENNFVELTLNISGRPIRRADIFNAINKKIPKIILIEGQPGIGKTSLASKLAFDWAEGKGYIARHFKILLHLPLRKLKQQQSFEDAIVEFGTIHGFGEKIKDIIKVNEHDTLFLLDGLDEVSEMNRYTILQLLYKKLFLYEHVHVLVTCRNGQFELTETERKQLFPYAEVTTKFCDVQITVEGIKSVEMKKMFLANFIENTNREDEIISKLEKLSPNLDFFNSPLFLMLMVFIVNNEKNNSPIFTQRTELYKRLFNCIIKHSCKKNEILLSQHFNLFDVSSDSKDSVKKKMIGEFGFLSLQKIIANDTIFVEDSFPIDIYNFGFLMKHKRILHCREDINYEAFHLSILEFAVAYSVWINYKSKNNFDENIITSIIKYFCYSNGTSLILPFIVGLLADDVNNLFQLTVFQQNFFQDIGIVLSMLEECQTKTVKRILPHLKNFLPNTIFVTGIKSFDSKTVDLCREIISFGANCEQIKTIQTDDKIPLNIMKKFIIPKVKIVKLFNENELQQGFDAVYANDLSTHESLSQFLSFFPSSNVTCQLRIFPIDVLNMNLDIFKAQRNSVAITMSSTSGQSSFKTNRVLFSHLDFEIQTNRQKKYLMKLLENNQVQYLNVKVLPAFKANMTDIYRAVSQSEYLTSLKITGATIIDLKDLTNNGSKDFALLDVDCRLICSHSLQRQIRCRSLSCFNISVSSLIEIEPIYLTCTIETIDDVMKECPYWTGFQSVNHLTVSINTNIENSNALLAFENLNLLHIIVNVSVDSKMMAQYIKYLPLTQLVIDDKFLDGNICQSLFEFWEKTDSNLQLITLKCLNKYLSDELLYFYTRIIDTFRSKKEVYLFKIFFNIFNKILSSQLICNKYSSPLEIANYDATMLLEMFRSALNSVTDTPPKIFLSGDGISDVTTPDFVTDFENWMTEIILPIYAEFRALINGLDKNYWQSVCLEYVSDFQMNELALDLSKFNVFRYFVWSNCYCNDCEVHKTNFDKHNLYPIYNYIIKRKLE